MGRPGRHVARFRARTAVAIPQGVFPAMDQAVVAADRALPHDVSRCRVKFGHDVAEAASAARTPPAGDVGVPITVRQAIGDPRDDRSEKEGEVEHRRRQAIGEIARLLVEVMAHVDDPARWFHDLVTLE